MFKYINMPKLVAFYLREFSVKASGEPSALYKFVFCLCLPFVSTAFRKARLAALAIAECTVSADQIARVLNAVTGVNMEILTTDVEYLAPYDGGEAVNGFNYNGIGETPQVPYSDPTNVVIVRLSYNGASILTNVEKLNEAKAYLSLLTPFYVKLLIV